ncbi:MAG: TonB-dependent receptor [Phenylobacterium sp.]|uniref:TonB-dependent receptor n=1 Tax=Phenylobacterium sp. TaxID=1871053 RepID=UPI001A5EFE1D|nr:TonB-dependent receptor [Phenylobacterium sp.]MBL8555447.1 TonB-dependent receptor [Phenylobacterium sp.]
MNDRGMALRNGCLAGASALAMAVCLGAGPALAQAASDQVDEVVVTGQRASDKASLEAKRAADSQVEVVSANDVGKLPDQNVAEAVRRLTGVSVATDKGEGRYLIIRGIEPNLANVTINNQTASAPEPENRNVKLDDIPSALIGSVTVVKSLTPDLDANAIAGQVDINTLSAFDKGRFFGSARGVYGIYDDTNRNAKEGDASIGGLFGADRQFGAVLAGNYSRRPSYSEDILSTSRQLVNGIDLPAEMDMRIYDPAIRTRKGAVANFDYRPTDDVKLYARLLYSQFADRELRNRFRFFFPADNNAADTTTLPPGYSALSASGGTINSTTARRLLRKRQEITDTTTINVGGEFNVGPGELKIEATHAESNKKDPIRDEVEYRAAASTGLGATFTTGDRLLDTFTANAAALNAGNYRLNNYKQVSRRAGEDLDQVRIDYKLPVEALGEGSYLKVGAKYLKRDRFQDQTGRTFTAVAATAGTRTLASDLDRDAGVIFDNRFTFGPTTSIDSAQAFVFGNPTQFTVNAADQVSQSKTSDYKVKEKVTAAYIMAGIVRGPLTIIPGVRMERTEGDTAAIIYRAGVTTLTSTFDSFGHYSYTDFFPGVNAKYEFSDHLLGRAAITTAIGRPGFVNLAPTVTVDTGSNTVSQGNPNLKPQKSLNFDISLEYYFESEGGVSVALFHKKIDDPVFATTMTGQTGTFGGVALTNAIVNSFGNGDSAELTGLELAFQKPLTFLPSPLDGFGVNANLTLTDGKLKVPGRTVKTPLIGQADKIASVQLYYEKYGVSARLAYTYHSSYLDTDGGLNVADPTGRSDGYFGALSTFDARAAYRFNRNVEVFVEGNNLTDAKDYYFFRTSDRFREAEKYGRSMRLGLTLTY